MDFHPWILGEDHVPSGGYRGASMLPWIFIHGYQDKTNSRNKIVSSASMLPWIFIHGYEYGALVKVVAFAWLQCCHGFSSMDTIGFFLRSPENSQASMLPWIFIHGYEYFGYAYHNLFPRFNVAMDFHPWILILMIKNVVLN